MGRSNIQKEMDFGGTCLKAPIRQCGYRCDALQQWDACIRHGGRRRAVFLAIIGDTPGACDTAWKSLYGIVIGAFGALPDYKQTADRCVAPIAVRLVV